MPKKEKLDIEKLVGEAARFAELESTYDEPCLYGVTDGKAVGTYLEHKFMQYLAGKYEYKEGNSASGIDFPGLSVDMKVTSVRQPQSSCPFKSARQKIYGLGYHLIVFVYEKTDDHKGRTGRLNMQHTLFVEQDRTADFQMTKGILQILENEGNVEDIVAFMQDKNLPVDDIEANSIAEEIINNPPKQGYLTISNALQWRLQYGRVIHEAGKINGINRVR
ncbi:MAG: restriction endonuclease [Deltaproteobacteria bacterium]|nr:restriction endonuclease [Deltaproteobacteria bacterium]